MLALVFASEEISDCLIIAAQGGTLQRRDIERDPREECRLTKVLVAQARSVDVYASLHGS